MIQKFYWSARTLRVHIAENEDDPGIEQDVLWVDSLHCINCDPKYSQTIVDALNSKFGQE